MITRINPHNFSLTRRPAREFFTESKIDGELDFEHFKETWSNLIALDMAEIFVYVDEHGIPSGIVGGTITKCTMTGDKVAQEAFWWIHPDLRGGVRGIRLLKSWEKRVTGLGAKRIYVGNLVGLNAELMHSIYERLGYKPLETHYVRTT